MMNRAVVVCAGWLVLGAIAGLGAPEARAQLATTRITTDVLRPIYVAQAPGDDARLFIVEKAGRIRVYNFETELLEPIPFLDIDSLVGGGNSNNDERGLLGLAFHPEYETNGQFFVFYTNTSNDTTVVRYNVSGDPDVADPNSAMTVLTVDQPQNNHNGGWIDFGPDDLLYISLGDGGASCDEDGGQGHTEGTGNAQDLTNNLLGKILRIDINGDDFPLDITRNYAIPVDNPFVDVEGDDEIWVYGLRNAWRCGFDRLTGDLYIGDVGQGAREEVDFQPFDSPGGENYGWRCMEGTACSSISGCDTSGCECGSPELTLPIFEYSHSSPPPPVAFVCSITGGLVYRGCAIPEEYGVYFYADYCAGHVWSFVYDGESVTDNQSRHGELSPSIEGYSVNQVVSFGEDHRGELYIVDQGSSGSTGQIFKIISANEADCNENGIADACDIGEGRSYDLNGNGEPDECELLGNCSVDSVVDLNDFLVWADCMAGPDAMVGPECACADGDGDGDADLFDIAWFQAIFGAMEP
jgi:hypothetical protein